MHILEMPENVFMLACSSNKPLDSGRNGKPWKLLRIYVGFVIRLKNSTVWSESHDHDHRTPLTSPILSPDSDSQQVAIDIPSEATDTREQAHERQVSGDNDYQQKGTDKSQKKIVAEIVKNRNSKALMNFGGAEKVALVLDSCLENGLDPKSCCCSCLEKEKCCHPPKSWNSTSDSFQEKSFLHFFLRSCNSITVFLLLISAGLSFLTQMLKDGPKNGWQDGIIILAAVFLLVLFPSVSAKKRQYITCTGQAICHLCAPRIDRAPW